MACYHPIPAFQSHAGAEVRLWPPVGTANLQLPCGGCLGCKTAKATEWARRAEHEASLYDHNCFLTLTYSDDYLPEDGSLEPTDLQKFIKRLRRARDRGCVALRSDRAYGLRYIACGEYGERGGRPHYHVLLFNCGFDDTIKVGKDLLESELLKSLWGFGQHRLGDLTPASANYVAQYTLKKQGNRPVCNEDGVVIERPFLRTSLKPAIGTRWLIKNKRDLTHGFLVNDGKKGGIPRSYKKQLRTLDPDLAEFSEYNAGKYRRPEDNLEAAEKIHQTVKQLSERRSL